MTYREKVIAHLQSKGSFDEALDSESVDDLIENINMSRKILKQIKREGVIQTYMTISGSKMTKMNPLVGIYQMFQRNTHQLSSKLGINRNDRLKLKIIEAKKDEEFDYLMKE